MNKERILAVAAAIEAEASTLRFDMTSYCEVSSCGTSACIAGWTMAMFEPEEWQDIVDRESGDFSVHFIAQNLLGLTGREADALFLPIEATQGVGLPDVTRPMAVSTLRRLAETGEVIWKD